MYCTGGSVRNRTYLGLLRHCTVIVGRLDILGVSLTCCDFVVAEGDQNGCAELQDCTDMKGALFPLLTDITGFVRLSDVSFPTGKDTLAQIFPALVAIHGFMGINRVQTATSATVTTAFLIECMLTCTCLSAYNRTGLCY